MMSLLDLEKLNENNRKQKLMRHEANNISRETGIPAHVINNEMRNEERKANVSKFELHDGNKFDDTCEDAKDEAMEIEKEEEIKTEKITKVKSKLPNSLSSSMPKTLGQILIEKPDYSDRMVVNDERT